MIKSSPVLLLVLLLSALASCKNAPVACFMVTTPTDSIKAGSIVKFDAGCSSGATAFYWDFGNGQDTTGVQTAQTVYTTVATYSVALVVGSSGKSNSLTKKIVVLP
jgi:PKD repeat protein